MTNHYSVLGLEVGATREQVDAAFDEVLAARRAKRQKTSDVHVAHAVLSDDGFRGTYDLALRGAAAGERLSGAKDAVVEAVVDAIPDIQWSEVRKNAVQAALQTTVLVAGFTARASDLTASVSRRVQSAAARKLS
jgi:curved DNA-binding protein CbpA